jgi:hypothetical protein
MFGYRHQDFLSLIMEFSDGKLKQKRFFHGVFISKLQLHFRVLLNKWTEPGNFSGWANICDQIFKRNIKQ